MENDFITSTGLLQTLCGESSAESEIILPDYCPPVMKIIKTEAQAMIRSQSVRGDRAFVEGSVNFVICYLAEGDAGVVSSTHRAPFSWSAELKSSEPPQILARARVSYYNTRALSPQKLFAKATVDVCVFAFCPNSVPSLPEESREGLELKTVPVQYSDVLCAEQKILKITDELELESKTDIASLLRSDIIFEEGEPKLLSDKVIARADMNLRLTYTKKDGTFGDFRTKIPLSQIVPTCELSDDVICLCFYELCEFRPQLKEQADRYVISYDAEICVSVLCYVEAETSLAVDAFSAVKSIECEQKPVSVHKIVRLNESSETEARAEAKGIAEVLDCSGSAYVSGCVFDSQRGVVKTIGNYEVFAIYKDVNGDILCAEKTVPFTLETPFEKTPSAMNCDIGVSVNSVSCTASGDEAVFKIKASCVGIADLCLEYGAVVCVKELPDKAARLNQTVLYYACKGDRVWDIAKRYCASPESIIKNNGLSGEVLDEDRMLYIM